MMWFAIVILGICSMPIGIAFVKAWAEKSSCVCKGKKKCNSK